MPGFDSRRLHFFLLASYLSMGIVRAEQPRRGDARAWRRRRKRYRLTAAGREALRAWVSEPTDELPELRDVALLKLFFDADAPPLADAQLVAHREKLREYEQLARQVGDDLTPGPLATLQAGIAHEREWVRYWQRLRTGGR